MGSKIELTVWSVEVLKQISIGPFFLSDVICPASQAVFIQPGEMTALIEWTPPAVNDDTRELAIQACDPESGSIFDVGDVSVTCEATDKDGFRRICQFHVKVVGM